MSRSVRGHRTISSSFGSGLSFCFRKPGRLRLNGRVFALESTSDVKLVPCTLSDAFQWCRTPVNTPRPLAIFPSLIASLEIQPFLRASQFFPWASRDRSQTHSSLGSVGGQRRGPHNRPHLTKLHHWRPRTPPKWNFLLHSTRHRSSSVPRRSLHYLPHYYCSSYSPQVIALLPLVLLFLPQFLLVVKDHWLW